MGKRILFVEDNNTHRLITQDFLTAREYSVVSLPDGSELFQTMKSFNPDLLLLDLKLPQMDGFMLLEQLQQSLWRSLPVIVISAYAFQKERQKAIDLGARSYLTKPINFEGLIQAIETELQMVTSIA